MSKRLTVTYGDVVLYDEAPGKITWSETGDGAIELKAGPVKANLLEQLAAMRRPPAIEAGNDREPGVT